MNKILLIIEDDAVRLFFREELLEEGYDVVDAGEYSVALALIREKNPDVVLGELRVTGMDCLEILYKIRQGYAKLPVILCTILPIHFDIRPFATDSLMMVSPDLRDLKSKIRLAMEGATETGDGAGRSPVKHFSGYEKGIKEEDGLPWGR